MMQVLDPRIGMLQRASGVAFYAFKNQEYGEGLPEDLRAWLDGILPSPVGRPASAPAPVPAPATKRSGRLREYRVRVELKYPAWDDRPFDKVVFAKNGRDAEKDVRNWMFREGHTRMDGPLILKATRVAEE